MERPGGAQGGNELKARGAGGELGGVTRFGGRGHRGRASRGEGEAALGGLGVQIVAQLGGSHGEVGRQARGGLQRADRHGERELGLGELLDP